MQAGAAAREDIRLVSAYVQGIYPRSEALVAATRDLDRGRTSPEAVDERFDQDLRELVELQREAGLDYFSDGLLRWQDLFRPLVEACPGLEGGALVRWFDNNTFYRSPEENGEITFDGALDPRLDTTAVVPSPRVATLPSPLVFSRISVARGSANEFMRELAGGLLRPAAEHLASRGYQLIQLQEPWLAFHGVEEGDWKHVEESIGMVTEGLQAKTVLHTYFGDAGPWIERLRDLPVDAIGVDFFETDVRSLGTGWGSKGLLVGAVNGRRSNMESVDEIVALVRMAAEAVQPSEVLVSSISDLELLPRDLAADKVRALGQAAAKLREEL
jgi:5-methyltetrahydropteroyltriglutamate--homocysteine methyltransferase